MINGRTFLTEDGRYIKEDEVNILNEKQNRAEETMTGMKVKMEWEKMSKSKKNGVDPSELFDEYSVDSIRLIMLADVLPRSPRNWSKDSEFQARFKWFDTWWKYRNSLWWINKHRLLFIAFPGILNWQHRIWLLLNEFNKARTDDSIAQPEQSPDYANEELKLFELRNTSVARADYFYSNAHFSSAIKECQEFTDELRVIFN